MVRHLTFTLTPAATTGQPTGQYEAITTDAIFKGLTDQREWHGRDPQIGDYLRMNQGFGFELVLPAFDDVSVDIVPVAVEDTGTITLAFPLSTLDNNDTTGSVILQAEVDYLANVVIPNLLHLRSPKHFDNSNPAHTHIDVTMTSTHRDGGRVADMLDPFSGGVNGKAYEARIIYIKDGEGFSSFNPAPFSGRFQARSHVGGTIAMRTLGNWIDDILFYTADHSVGI